MSRYFRTITNYCERSFFNCRIQKDFTDGRPTSRDSRSFGSFGVEVAVIASWQDFISVTVSATKVKDYASDLRPMTDHCTLGAYVFLLMGI